MKENIYKHWNDDKDRLIIELIERGENPKEHPGLLAEHSACAIKVRCSTLRKKGFLKKNINRQRYKWDEDEQRLIELVNKGQIPQKDPELLERHSKWSIIKHCTILRKIGVIKKVSRGKKGWTDDENNLITELLANGEKPQHNAALLARHTQSAILVRASLIRRYGVPSDDKANEAPTPSYSVILRSMVSPLQRKALIGGMFN